MITFKFRRAIAAMWSAIDPTLKSGEPGFETDTGKLKIGDGIKKWSQLGYLSGEGTPGPAGADGEDGSSAYDLAVEEGFVGTVTEWLDSLKGEPGPQGETGPPGAGGSDGADYSGPAITVSPTAPSEPSIGDVWIDTSV